VVQQWEPDDVACARDLGREAHVFFARGRVSTRVVVDQDERRASVAKRQAKRIARPHVEAVKPSASHEARGAEPLMPVEDQGP
jgi:hypothetical protein